MTDTPLVKEFFEFVMEPIQDSLFAIIHQELLQNLAIVQECVDEWVLVIALELHTRFELSKLMKTDCEYEANQTQK